MIGKILVAIDGSPASEKALDIAIDEAKARDAELHAIFVVPGPPPDTTIHDGGAHNPGAGTSNPGETLNNTGGLLLGHAEAAAAGRVVGIITHCIYGDPPGAIIELSEEIGADLIILGSSGKNGFDRLFLGSVSSGVVEQSRITTIIARN